jgi:L-ascorbate metabolism protein UlaG (beta-lactamase superfamily)
MNRMKSLSALIGSFFLLHGTAPASDAKQERQEKIRKSRQYRDGKFRNVVEFPMIEGSYMGMFKELIFGKQVRVPTSPLPQMPMDSLNFGEPPQDLQVVWLGHSTLLLEVEGKRFLVDPVLGSHAAPLPVFAKRFQAPLLSREQLPRIDAILISHDHYDHLEKETMEFYAHKGVPIYVPIGVGGHLEEWGVDAGSIHELDWWEETDFHGIRLVCTPSQHFSGRGLTDRAKTLWASWAVIGKAHRVFYSGDGGYADHFKTIGDRLGPFDLTLMENGAYDKQWPNVHMFPEQVVKAHRELKGKALMPVHWGMFSLANHDWFEPVRRLSAAAKKDEVRLLTPKLGQAVRPKEDQVFEAWWEPKAAAKKPAAVSVAADNLQGAVR